MRSFIKSHRRGSSGGLDEQLPPLNTSDSFLHTSPVASTQTSPGRAHIMTSPSYKSGNKLQRLFQRNKSASGNVPGMGLYPVSPGRSSSPPPSIIGTRTHEWGSRPSQEAAVRVPTRITNSEVSSSGSISSSGESNRTSSASASASISNNHDNDFIQLPLNTVLEIPDSISPTHNRASSSEVRKKNLHRRAQIVTADSPMSQSLSQTLEDAPEILPTLDASIFNGLDFDEQEEDDYVSVMAPAGLAPAAEIVASPSTVRLERTDDTVEVAQEERPVGSITPIKTPEDNEEMVQKTSPLVGDQQLKEKNATNDDANSSHESEFSFEQDGMAGRNTSIRYYKDPQEVQKEESHVAREQGFYINDFMEDDFDEDMNYFDEDDDYNDDEELFNKKYFSDEEEPVSKLNELKISQDEPQVQVLDAPGQTIAADVSSSTPFTSPPQSREQPLQQHYESFPNPETEILELHEELNALRPTRSLKYHQLPGSYEHEFSERRYSWLSEDENPSNRGSQSYDSLLDEINGIPDDFDYDDHATHSTPQPARSKTLNSVLKMNKGIMEDLPQNTKFETSDKTVTLFHRSRTNSLRSSTQSPDPLSQLDKPNATIVAPKGQDQFSYLTPNNSFTTPLPLFRNERDVELSPISEGSYIDDSTMY